MALFNIRVYGILLDENNRLLVSDKMHFVSFIGQSLAQLCGQNTTTTKSGVTNNAYTHTKINFRIAAGTAPGQPIVLQVTIFSP